MQTERVHSLILRAGPSRLAAGYMLAKAGVKPVVLEKDKVPGGLMRSIKHGDFIMVGRKELYNRITKVDALWSDTLCLDYRDYPHRGEIVCKRRIKRTGTDIGALAGLDAAEANLSRDRSHFGRRVDPAELKNRSESKAFEFQPPISIDD